MRPPEKFMLKYIKDHILYKTLEVWHFFFLYTFASFQTQEMNTKNLFTKQNPARFLFYSAFMFAQSKTLVLIG